MRRLGGYEDIISLEHHRSVTRKQMSMHDRAAQFAPFAALTGYGDAVAETARLTDSRIEPDEDMAAEIDMKLGMLREMAYSREHISVEHFVPDGRKSGGTYIRTDGEFKRVNIYDRLIEFYGDMRIPIDDIYRISGEIFSDMKA